MKLLWITLGSIALVLAIIGIFLPLLPTTPFLLLASACYLRGSKRLHDSLQRNRVFGPILRNYETHRAISRKTKITAITLLWLSMSYAIWITPAFYLQCLLGAIALGVTVYLLRMRTLERIGRV